MFTWGDGWLPFEDYIGTTLDEEVKGWRDRYGLEHVPRPEQARPVQTNKQTQKQKTSNLYIYIYIYIYILQKKNTLLCWHI